MLQNKFYHATPAISNGEVLATITFQKEHPIFSGHFPGHPVVPGVCMIQIVRELLEDTFQSNLTIRSGDNIKFLSVINPIETPSVQASIQPVVNGDQIDVQAAFFVGQTFYFKFKGSFEKV